MPRRLGAPRNDVWLVLVLVLCRPVGAQEEKRGFGSGGLRRPAIVVSPFQGLALVVFGLLAMMVGRGVMVGARHWVICHRATSQTAATRRCYAHGGKGSGMTLGAGWHLLVVGYCWFFTL